MINHILFVFEKKSLLSYIFSFFNFEVQIRIDLTQSKVRYYILAEKNALRYCEGQYMSYDVTLLVICHRLHDTSRLLHGTVITYHLSHVTFNFPFFIFLIVTIFIIFYFTYIYLIKFFHY